MKISDLINELRDILRKHGDIEVTVDTRTHTFPPDVAVRERGVTKIVVLNA